MGWGKKCLPTFQLVSLDWHEQKSEIHSQLDNARKQKNRKLGSYERPTSASLNKISLIDLIILMMAQCLIY